MVQTRATGRPFPGWGTSDNKIAAIWIALAMVTSLTIGGVIGLSNVDSWLYINSSTWVNGSMNISEDLFVNGTVTAGALDIQNLSVENMNFTNLTITGDIFNISADETYVNALFPNEYCTSDLGSDALRWRNIFVCGNVTAGEFYGDGSHLTNLPAGTEVDPLWTGNQSSYFTSAQILGFSYYNSTDFDIADYLLISNWNSTNESYYLITNPFGFYNSTNPQVELDPKWSANYSTFLTHIDWSKITNGTIWSWAMNGTLFKTSQWNATNTSYYLDSNPDGYISSIPDNYLLNTGDTASGDYNFDSGTLFVDASANSVGIGTTGPSAKFEIQQDMSNYSTAFTSPHLNLDTGVSVDNIGFVGITYAASTIVDYGWSSGALRTSGGASNFVWKYHIGSAEGTERMRIDTTGKVGIGTTTPDTILHLSSTNPDITFEDTTGDKWIAGNNNGDFRIRDVTDSRTDLTIDGTGNVGIGTETPDAKLEILRTSGKSSIKAVASDGYMMIDSNGQQLRLNNYVTDNIILGLGGGNVSIGTASITERLYVVGKIYTTLGRRPAGSLHGDTITINAIFDALAPSIPNTNDEIIVNGGMYALGFIISKAKRTGASTIDLYEIDSSGTGTITITDGSAVEVVISISW